MDNFIDSIIEIFFIILMVAVLVLALLIGSINLGMKDYDDAYDKTLRQENDYSRTLFLEEFIDK